MAGRPAAGREAGAERTRISRKLGRLREAYLDGDLDDNERSFELATQALDRGRKRFDDLEELLPRRVQRTL